MALGAGGARGLAHIGVLKTIERVGLSISHLAGSSMGAIIGAAYLVNHNAAALEKRFLEFMSSSILEDAGINWLRQAFNDKPATFSERVETWLKRTYVQARAFTGPFLIDSDVFMEIIAFFVPDIKIEDLPVPFWALGSDLKTGRAVVFKKGSLQKALYASAAIPGVIRPYEVDGRLVVDGGVLNMVPVIPARHMGADRIMAVDVERLTLEGREYGNIMEILFRVEDMQNACLKELQLRFADLVIRPKVGHLHWSDFSRAHEAIRLGQDEAAIRAEEMVHLSRQIKIPWLRRRLKPPRPAFDWIEF